MEGLRCLGKNIDIQFLGWIHYAQPHLTGIGIGKAPGDDESERWPCKALAFIDELRRGASMVSGMLLSIRGRCI
jgi:hypothetical protein